jgi:hypothetical protein
MDAETTWARPSRSMSGHDEEATTSTGTRGGAYFPAPDELDPNVAINLNSLRDAPPDGKPLYSYATLIRYVWPLLNSQTLIITCLDQQVCNKGLSRGKIAIGGDLLRD